MTKQFRYTYKFTNSLLLRFLMNTINTWNFLPLHKVGNRNIRRNHTVFNHFFRMTSCSWTHICWMTIYIYNDFTFYRIKFNCTFMHSLLTNCICTISQHKKQITKMFIFFLHSLISIQDLINIVICHSLCRANHRWIHFIIHNITIKINIHITC